MSWSNMLHKFPERKFVLLILAREILKSAPGPEVRVYESLSGEQVRVRESAEVCNAGGDRQSDTMPLATVFCWHEYQSRLFVFAALHSAPLTNTPLFSRGCPLGTKMPLENQGLTIQPQYLRVCHGRVFLPVPSVRELWAELVYGYALPFSGSTWEGVQGFPW